MFTRNRRALQAFNVSTALVSTSSAAVRGILSFKLVKKVKQSRYRPGVAQRVPRS